jgi:hypothetical protein
MNEICGLPVFSDLPSHTHPQSVGLLIAKIALNEGVSGVYFVISCGVVK